MKDRLKNIAKYFRFVIAVGLTIFNTANSQTISGRLVEEGTTSGLNEQNVQLYLNNNKTPILNTTDANGNFSILTAIEDNQNIEVQNDLEYIAKNNSLSINIDGEISIYNIIGKETLKKELKKDNPTALPQFASGIYLTRIKTNNGQEYFNKFTLLDGKITSIGVSRQKLKSPIITTTSNPINKTNNYTIDSIIISSPDIQGIPQVKDTTIKGLGDYSEDINLGTIELTGKNIIQGFAYDLNTKYNNRTGIDSSEIFLESTPEKIYQITNGLFNFKTARNSPETIIILSSKFYNWKHPINISTNTEVKAFNDKTGIPMIKRYEETGIIPVYDGTQWKDSLTTEDLIEFTQKITEVAIHHYSTDPIFDYTVPRFKNDTVLVYLNRPNSPISYYPDSSLAGLKYLEDEKRHFKETTDSIEAQIHMRYNNINVGNGENMKTAFDESGQPYIQNWDISIAGPDALIGILKPEWVAPVVAHEGEHALFFSGEHSLLITDLIYAGVLSRYNAGYNSTGSEKEIKARKILSHTERNPKLLEYYK